MSQPTQRRVENSIMRLAMSSTEATLGSSGYHAVIHVAGLQQLLDSPPPDNTQLETTGEDFSALLNSIEGKLGQPRVRPPPRRRCGRRPCVRCDPQSRRSARRV